ncbi:ABC transporter permease [Phreatobacter oligotrophus]|jgi:putative spermidine/putrescine transport system permease protein|uniref:Putative spermidine/putrescine transport system permease protein n=1 Tax=Phreatobacter oligotrophus TaxID=1122261 RepID=A0A2T4Z107_9HYPH|nr:ABC transporter permease [Phreatobacter oligotrophus]PTM53436.1 putative spermidine/putrescine transport system permease protein [Phreatobacter oligotrophus]
MATLTQRPVGEPGALTAAGLLVPASLFVAIGLLVPIAILFRYSLNAFEPGKLMVDALTIANYVKFFSDPFYLQVLWRTIRVAVACTVFCLLLGFPLAYVLARTQSRFKNLLVMAIVLPLFVGNAVRAAGWMVAFGSKGFVNASLMGLGLTSAPIEIMYTEFAVVVGIIAVNLPFMVLTLQSVIEGIDRNVEEAAFSLGAPPMTMAMRVLFPLALPGILAGVILTFILAMNAYATPVLLGGPKFQTMGPLVFSTFAQQNNWPFGGAVSFVLMTATLILTVASSLLIRRRYA